MPGAVGDPGGGDSGVEPEGHRGVRLRCGAGGIRSRFRIRRTVDVPTRYPRPSSSPWIRL